MKIELNAQSSIKITSNKTIYFDPYKIEEESHDADLIFITHDHYDHFDLSSINKISKDNTLIIMPDNIVMNVFSEIKSSMIRGVVPNENYVIEDVSFKTIPSYNTNKQFHKKEYNWVGYLVNIEDQVLYIAGDTDITEENQNVSCDIAFLPIGGTYTMDYKEAAKLANIINPKTVIPTHYKTIVGTDEDAIKFSELLNNNIECKIIME